jgi:hypothetical protein
MSVNFHHSTPLNIPEESHLYIRGRENLKTHFFLAVELTVKVQESCR